VRPLARVVDEGLLAGAVHLAHRRTKRLCPATIPLAELAIAIAIRLSVDVLVPKKLQRHAGAAEFSMHPGKVGVPTDNAGGARLLEDPRLQSHVVKILGQRPGQPGFPGPTGVLGHRPHADRASLGDGPVAETVVLEPQNLA